MTLLTWIQTPAVIRALGMAGSLVVVLASLITALAYRGRRGERYAIARHFISELGELGVSRLAWLFNGALILGGALLFLCSVGLGLRLPGLWSKLGLLAGGGAAVGVALVGVYPMNNIKPHVRAAMAYFRLGLVMVALFSLAIALQPAPVALPRGLSLLGLPAIAAYAFFLAYLARARRQGGEALDPGEEERPRFWLLPFAEWLTFLTTIPWFFAVTLGL